MTLVVVMIFVINIIGIISIGGMHWDRSKSERHTSPLCTTYISKSVVVSLSFSILVQHPSSRNWVVISLWDKYAQVGWLLINIALVWIISHFVNDFSPNGTTWLLQIFLVQVDSIDDTRLKKHHSNYHASFRQFNCHSPWFSVQFLFDETLPDGAVAGSSSFRISNVCWTQVISWWYFVYFFLSAVSHLLISSSLPPFFCQKVIVSFTAIIRNNQKKKQRQEKSELAQFLI